jgi:tetratricopeptide (TPR) repeat protein
MKPISKIKDEARRHEQREEWEQAARLYLEALRSGDEGEGEVELPLYNRVGDLYVRMGRADEAVQFYEQAADRYAEAGLYNNAIALCNKALRYQPARLELLRKLGQFSASQGFVVDARRYFLDYAERQFSAGAVDDALSALEDFANVAEDGEIRELLGRRLQTHGRTADAVHELGRAYILFTQEGNHDRAETALAAVRELNPSAAEALEPSSMAEPPQDDNADDDDEELAWSEPAWADSAESAELEDDAGLELESAGAFDASAHDAVEAGPPEGFESTFLAADDLDDSPPEGFEAFESDLAGEDAAEPEETAGLTGNALVDDSPPDEDGAVDVQRLEGFEAGSLDFAAAVEELGTIESDLELERDETSFDEGSFDEGSFDDAVMEETPSAGELPDTDEAFLMGEAPLPDPSAEAGEAAEAEEGSDAFALPALEDYDVAGDDSSDDAGTGFVLPGLDYDDDVAAGDGAADAALPLLDDDDAGEAALPLLGTAESEPGAGLPLLEDDDAAALALGHGEAGPAEAEPADAAPAHGWEPEPLQPSEHEAPEAPAAEPVASAEEDFIDLGQLLAEERSDSTRFQIQETAPTGDEDRDFAELLSQFKDEAGGTPAAGGCRCALRPRPRVQGNGPDRRGHLRVPGLAACRVRRG